jgi:hypothetical protein
MCNLYQRRARFRLVRPTNITIQPAAPKILSEVLLDALPEHLCGAAAEARHD